LKSDFDKAAAAERMVAEAFTQAVEMTSLDSAPPGDLQAGEANGPGFLKLWGLHATIAAGALALIGAVAWLALKRSWSPV
jgi:hypothetical protein